MKGRIIQSAKLYLQKEDEEKARHVKRWSDYVRICDELGASTAYDERTFLNDEDFPPLGRPITEWPEKEPNYKVGPERLFFCVPPEADFQRIKDVGATMIQTYGITWLADKGQAFLDKAEEHGLKVLYSIKSEIHDLLRHGKPWNRAECQRLVAKFDNHPALYGWFILDEPDAGIDHPEAGVSKALQREIYDAFRSWTDKPLAICVRGGTKGWHLVDFSLWEIIPDSYVFDGTGKAWGEDPIEYLGKIGKQEYDFMQETEVNLWGFMFQCDNGVAKVPDTKVPLGEIENQFNVLAKHNLFPKGIAMYGWDGGDFCPNTDEEIYNEIKDLFDKIKEE